MITPINQRVLVKLMGQFENFDVTEERFGTSKTRGEVIAIADELADEPIKVGQIAYFGKYEDGARYPSEDGEDYILIKYEDIGGIE